MKWLSSKRKANKTEKYIICWRGKKKGECNQDASLGQSTSACIPVNEVD